MKMVEHNITKEKKAYNKILHILRNKYHPGQTEYYGWQRNDEAIYDGHSYGRITSFIDCHQECSMEISYFYFLCKRKRFVTDSDTEGCNVREEYYNIIKRIRNEGSLRQG